MNHAALISTLLTNAGFLIADAGWKAQGEWLLEGVEKGIPVSPLNLRAFIGTCDERLSPRIRTACDSLRHVLSLLEEDARHMSVEPGRQEKSD